MTVSNSNLVAGNDSSELLQLQTPGVLQGADGNDTLLSAPGRINDPGSLLLGGLGDDRLESRGFNDTLFGNPGDDYLRSNFERSELYGNAGNDTLDAVNQRNTLDGGAGSDYLRAMAPNNLLIGGSGDDVILSEDGDATIAGLDGEDFIRAASGRGQESFLFGNRESDTILSSAGEDSLFGGQQNDYLFVDLTSTDDKVLMAGDKDADTLIYAGAGRRVVMDGDRSYLGVSSRSDETSVPDTYADYLLLGGSQPLEELTAFGGPGNDSLIGVTGGLGREARVYLGRGDDYADVNAPGEEVELFGDLGKDTLIVEGTSNQTIYGDNRGDIFDEDYLAVNNNGGPMLVIADSADSLDARGSNDRLILSGGSIVAIAGGGDDYLESKGDNTLVGGAGSDTYIFAEGDIIPFDSLGVNTYLTEAETSTSNTITVRPSDRFTGGATFVIADPNSVLRFLTNGGIVTGDNNDFIDIGTIDALVQLAGDNDTLNAGNIAIQGSAFTGLGNDIVTVNDGLNGLLNLGDGDDSLTARNLPETGSILAGAGNDILALEGTDLSGEIALEEGNDSIALSSSEPISVTTSLGDGNDTLSATGNFTGVGSGDAGDDVFFIEAFGPSGRIDAGEGDDIIVVPGGVDEEAAGVTGGAGNDTISVGSTDTGSSGFVVIEGNDGDDALFGRRRGGDILVGGDGNDTLMGGLSVDNPDYGTTPEDLTEGGLYAGDTLEGGAGQDVYLFPSTTNLGYVGADLPVGTLDADGLAEFENIPVGLNRTDFDGTIGTYTGYFNGVFNADTLVDYSSEDRIVFSTEGGFGVTTPGTYVDGIAPGLSFYRGTTALIRLNIGGGGLNPGFRGFVGTAEVGLGDNFEVGDLLFDISVEALYIYQNKGGVEGFNLVALFPPTQDPPLTGQSFAFVDPPQNPLGVSFL